MNELISIFCEQLPERWKIPVLPPSVQLQFFISGFFQRHTLFTSHHLLNISKVFLTWHINSSNRNGRKALHALNPAMDRNWVAGSDQVWLASLLTFYFSVGVYSVVRQIIVETELSTCLLWRIFIR